MPQESSGLARKVAPLLFGSGFCALVYQLAWQRQLRLVFGASTAASAAVIAIFIGGLGAGALLLGKRVDRHPKPLAMYAQLELVIAVSAAATPLFVALTSKLYLALGGQSTLGTFGATALRLVLSAIVLAVPTFAMGGTLPAAARAVETSDDAGRTRVGLLYGINTFGAVVGCVVATFALLEIFGTRRTLWMAALVNLIVAVIARGLARDLPAVTESTEEAAGEGTQTPRAFVIAAAAAVGFGFFLMELVWYRMLGPLLGGTVFTFGLILGTALLGIGIGGALYARMPSMRRATVAAFAATCLLEALFVALPFALGDHIATLALGLRQLGLEAGFLGHIGAWTSIAMIVIVPAAIVAGFQFPLLIALAGSGRRDVGQQIGVTYAANTAGAIVGSLAGGFGMLPLLGALGCWRAAAGVLLVIGVAALALALRDSRAWKRAVVPAVTALAVIAMLLARGPTAAWRHGAIGAGRVDGSLPSSHNALEDWVRMQRRVLVWEQDGVESSVALTDQLGYAFVVNGKIDGNARIDAPTQVMGGLVGAIFHPQPKRSLVIGLGTGSTAGWLAAVPGMERVDVVELEPAVLDVARACAPVNHNALAEPNVHVTIGDAREALLTSSDKWDIVFSEPSNPYRAGVSSLFTREYYAAVASHLADDGLFLQWVQAYEVDAETIRTIYASLSAEFPYVTTFELVPVDMLLIASKKPLPFDADKLRARLAQEPFKTALAVAWRTSGLEGFLARFIARPSLATAIAASGQEINTDDLNTVEFGFARNLAIDSFGPWVVRMVARERHEDRPEITGTVDWDRVSDEESLVLTSGNTGPPLDERAPDAVRHRVAAQRAYAHKELAATYNEWHAQPQAPRSITELELVAISYAGAGDDSQPDAVAQLRAFDPAEADVVAAVRAMHDQNLAEATAALVRVFKAVHTDPWVSQMYMDHALGAARAIAAKDPTLAAQLYAEIRTPFAVHYVEEQRKSTALRIAARAADKALCTEAAHAFEPEFPWEPELLALRYECYTATHDPLAPLAADEVRSESAARRGTVFDRGLGSAALR